MRLTCNEDIGSSILSLGTRIRGDTMTKEEKPAEKNFHEDQLKKVRNLKPANTKPAVKPKFVPKFNTMRKAGRGR